MTDRISSFVVVLDDDLREDDAEATLTALRMVRGVISVAPQTSTVEQIVAEARVATEWRSRIIDWLQEMKP